MEDDDTSASDHDSDYNISDLDDSINDPTYEVQTDPEYVAIQKEKKYARNMKYIQSLIQGKPTFLFEVRGGGLCTDLYPTGLTYFLMLKL